MHDAPAPEEASLRCRSYCWNLDSWILAYRLEWAIWYWSGKPPDSNHPSHLELFHCHVWSPKGTAEIHHGLGIGLPGKHSAPMSGWARRDSTANLPKWWVWRFGWWFLLAPLTLNGNSCWIAGPNPHMGRLGSQKPMAAPRSRSAGRILWHREVSWLNLTCQGWPSGSSWVDTYGVNVGHFPARGPCCADAISAFGFTEVVEYVQEWHECWNCQLLPGESQTMWLLKFTKVAHVQPD